AISPYFFLMPRISTVALGLFRLNVDHLLQVSTRSKRRRLRLEHFKSFFGVGSEIDARRGAIRWAA
ncbi:MAG TPA: hypothetical protein VFX54_22485, partial [Candidatus Binatia bacterium]|nr:hypothetical protein [Candidatus Binatia bacterium]